MKQTLALAVLGLAGAGVAAQEIGLVVSSVPVIQQVAVPRQVCTEQPVVVQQQPSGAGGILGAIAGAAIGSQIGGGSGRGVATVLGTVGGAMLGHQVEGGGQHVQNVPQCSTQTSYENRTVAWNVTYEYAGRQYTVQMPYDPGPTLRLQVTPVGAGPQQPAQAAGPEGPVVIAPPVASAPVAPMAPAAPVAVAPMVLPPAPLMVVPAYPVVPAYAPVYRPYPPVSISFGFGFHSHRGHRHHRRHHHHWH